MTFQFAHMAPPGAAHRRQGAAHPPVARWLRCAQTGQLVMHWSAPPRAPDVGAPVETLLDALLSRQSDLRAA